MCKEDHHAFLSLWGGSKNETELTAQYKVVISGQSTCTITNLKTGEVTSIDYYTAATSPQIFGNMKIAYNNSGGYYWILTDINGLYLAYRQSSVNSVSHTAQWMHVHTITGTWYFCDSITLTSIPVLMTMP